MYALVERLYPLCRSITGDGVRATLDIVGEYVPLQVHEVPTGTQVLDWTVPQEWNIRDAYVADAAGHRVVDFAASSLHVLGYSVPVSATMPLAELREHLHTLPGPPGLGAVPHQLLPAGRGGSAWPRTPWTRMPDGEYEVRIDSTLADGHLTYAEHVRSRAGRRRGDRLLPRLPPVARQRQPGRHRGGDVLARALAEANAVLHLPVHLRARHHRGDHLAGPQRGAGGAGQARARAGLRRRPGQRSRTSRADAATPRSTGCCGTCWPPPTPAPINDFTPYGYDERQYCSPGFNLGVGSLTRTPYAGYPEYHTSADNLDFVSPEAMADTLAVCREAFAVLDRNRRYVNLSPYGEPQLGRRGLYDALGGRSDTKQAQMAMLWVLSLSDGEHGLLDVAERSGLPFDAVAAAADALHEAGLIKT